MSGSSFGRRANYRKGQLFLEAGALAGAAEVAAMPGNHDVERGKAAQKRP